MVASDDDSSISLDTDAISDEELEPLEDGQAINPGIFEDFFETADDHWLTE
jgi:hypothetical protein